MFTAIETKFHGPSNTRGSRISAATTNTHSNDKIARIYVDYDHRYNSDTNHKMAAQALARKLKWHGQWYGGATSTGCVFVRRVPGDVGAYDFVVE